MFVDLANDLGVPFAAISDATRTAMQEVLDPGVVAENPLDAWGTGIDADRIFRENFQLLHDDPETAAVAFAVDLARQGEPYDESYIGISRDVFAATTKPFCALSNLRSAVAHEEAAILREAGIPVLEGTESGLLALRHLLDEGERHGRPGVVAPEPVAGRGPRPLARPARRRARRSPSSRDSPCSPTTACRSCRRAALRAPTRPWPPPPSWAGPWC